MSVSCHVLLPARARINDVAQVMGILAGLKPRREIYVTVSGATVDPSRCLAPMVEIILREPEGKALIDGAAVHTCYYHFEGRGGKRLLGMPSTDFWTAIAKRLVDFFGGSVDYNDCDEVKIDYEKPTRRVIDAEDGLPWQRFETAKFNVTPLTLEDLVAARRAYAAYKEVRS
jgi:hypothetical protein